MPVTSNIPFFERAWHISVDTRYGQHVVLSSSDMDNSLRAIFSITRLVNVAFWEAEITVYNVNNQTTQLVGANQLGFSTPLSLGDGLSISAGYKFSSTGVFKPETNELYSGAIFQPIWTRDNVVDSHLTLRCLVGLFENAYNFVNRTLPAGVNSYDVVKAISEDAKIPFATPNSVDQDTLKNQKYSRSQTLFGRPYDKFAQIAKDSNMMTWVQQTKDASGISQYGLNLRSLKFDPNVTPKYTYAPPNLSTSLPQEAPQGILKKTLIGTPEQTQYGVSFRVLMDAQPQLADVIQIAPGTAIKRIPINIGQYPSILDQKGLYLVTQIRHVGDTRGGSNSWYTEIEGVTYSFFPLSSLLLSPNRVGG